MTDLYWQLLNQRRPADPLEGALSMHHEFADVEQYEEIKF